MNTTDLNSDRLPPAIGNEGRVLILEAAAGKARDRALDQWLQKAHIQGAKTWLLPCNYETDGIWAGLKDIFAEIVLQLQVQAPHLLQKHGYEITMLLPAWRRKIAVDNLNLTDIAVESERTRAYPLDRAYRIVHGLIDLFDVWYHNYTNRPTLAIACNEYERSGFLVRRFLAELARRRGKNLNLSLLIAVNRDSRHIFAEQFPDSALVEHLILDLPPEEKPKVDPIEMRHLAEQLELLVGKDEIETEFHLPQLIHYWRLSDRPQKALEYQALAIAIYNHQGLYEDVLSHIKAVRPQIQLLCGMDSVKRLNLIHKIFNCYIALGQPKDAQQLIEEEVGDGTDNPYQPILVNYMMAMLHSRFLPDKDLAKASHYLESTLRHLQNIDIPDREKYFHTAFTMNGLAFVRFRQGKGTEAIALCNQASDLLDAHLAENEHILHRSVLIYNSGQVYDFLGDLDKAIDYYSTAMAMDPNYSDYYNDRGNAYLKQARFESAIADYLQAIELSPPYAEVWFNLGLCYQKMGQLTESARAFATALDLKPDESSVWIELAQIHEELGLLEEAIADYSAALALAPQPLLFANRAILHYQVGNLQESLNDLNEAIRLSPENPELYQNRAAAFFALQQFESAVSDLQTYLRLNPQAEDRSEVEHHLCDLLTKI